MIINLIIREKKAEKIGIFSLLEKETDGSAAQQQAKFPRYPVLFKDVRRQKADN